MGYWQSLILVSGGGLTQIAADLATPRGYAMRFAKFGQSLNNFRGKNAKSAE